jgi:hypothetical protein
MGGEVRAIAWTFWLDTKVDQGDGDTREERKAAGVLSVVPSERDLEAPGTLAGYNRGMNANSLKASAASLVILGVGLTGCGGQSRGNADANQNRAASPAEGGGTSTAGSAGESKNFGDTRAKTEAEGRSQTASPTGLSKDVVPGQTPPATSSPPKEPQSGK